MKTLSSTMIDMIESEADPKGTWIILDESCGRFRPAERVTFYEYADRFFCVIDRMGSRARTIGYQYDSREEGNLHFTRMKLESAVIGNIFVKDRRSL